MPWAIRWTIKVMLSLLFRQLLLSYRLDDLIELFHLPYPQHIKIDVDGIEFSVLKGSQKTLGNSACRSLMLEINEGPIL